MPDTPNSRYIDLADKHLNGITDPITLILKSHMLIEIALRDALADIFIDKELLNKARLSFYQLICLARSTDKFQKYSDSKQIQNIWSAIEALNSLRNVLAHQLEPENPQKLLSKLMFTGTYNGEEITDPAIFRGLNHACGFLLGAIASFAVTRGAA